MSSSRWWEEEIGQKEAIDKFFFLMDFSGKRREAVKDVKHDTCQKKERKIFKGRPFQSPLY